MGSTKKTIAYRFDSVGNRIGMTDPDGGRFTYAYDAVNRITHLENPQGERTTYGYDPTGRRSVKKLANGTRASFSYDAAGNLTTLANLKSDNTVISSFEYAYDRMGNRTSVVEADGSRVTWTYDATYQLTGEHRTGSHPYEDSYSYDAAGNRLLKIHDGARTTSSYDAANQLEWTEDALGRTTYTFDANGNQTGVEKPNGDRTTTTWDFENRTTLVEEASGIRNTMTYEPGGLRVKLEESTGTKKFVWDDQNYLAETDENDDTQVVYTNEPRVYGNLVSQRRGSDSHWYHFDAIGSTRELTDSGSILRATYTYDAWGTTVSSSGTKSPFRYIGRSGYYYDLEIASNYVRARIYKATTGSWTSSDPLELANPCDYKYANNSPTVGTDPSGLMTLNFKNYSHTLCGGYTAKVLGFPFPFNNAWNYPLVIVQMVKMESFIEICDESGGCVVECDEIVCSEYNEPCEFYEFLTIYQNENDILQQAREQVDPMRDEWLDSVAFKPVSLPGSCPNTRGWRVHEHELRVFSLTQAMLNTIVGWPTKVECHGIETRTSHASKDKPTFWDQNPILDKGWHLTQIDWNCCVEPPTQCYGTVLHGYDPNRQRDVIRFPPDDCAPLEPTEEQEAERPTSGGCEGYGV